MVRKEDCNEEEDWKRIQKQMESEIKELREDAAANFAMELDDYRKQVKFIVFHHR